MKLLLFDGNSVMTSNYYGSAPFRGKDESDEEYFPKIMQTSSGKFTNAIVITLKQMISQIIRDKPDYVAFAFDKTRNTFRREIYSEYKGTRGTTPSPLKEQISTMQDVLARIGIPYFVSDRYEADDLLASITHQFKSIPDMQIEIVTKDRDYYQLVDDNVLLWQAQPSEEKANQWYKKWGYSYEQRKNMPTKMVPITSEVVVDEFGVFPELIPDVKGIIGDTSDNIPGVKGVSSAAATLLSYYGSIENIYAAIDKDIETFTAMCKILMIKRNPTKALLAERENAYLSKKLATMIIPDIDAEITKYLPGDINELKLSISEEIFNVVKELEITSLDDHIRALQNTGYLSKMESEKPLHLAIVSDTNDSLDALYLTIRKLSAKRKCKLYCNKSIGTLITEKYDTNSFISKDGDKAYLLVIHAGAKKSNIERMIKFAKDNNCQIRIAVLTDVSAKIIIPA